jgi:uncharacterized protein (TIGR03083 family)
VVLDGYRHLTGVCSDFLDGRLEGAGTPEWTAAQLEARAGRTIDEVCAEWAERGPEVDTRIAAAGDALAFLAFDAWTHEQDIRAAVGVNGVRDDECVPALASVAITTFGPRYSGGGAPSISIVVDGQSHALGEGEPVAELDTTAYEVLRIIFGRRSEGQIAAAGWSGDCEQPIAAIHLFDPPKHDITD